MTEFSHKINRLCQVVVRHPDFLFPSNVFKALLLNQKQEDMNRKNIVSKFIVEVVGILGIVYLTVSSLVQLDAIETAEKELETGNKEESK